MKSGRLFILALVLPGLFCHAQGKESAGKSAKAMPPSSARPAVDSYVIGKSDVLSVTVWKQPDLSGNLLVRPDGMVSMPLLGDRIETKLKKYMQDPEVSVVVTQINSKVIYLLGEVGKKGPVQMTAGMTLLEAIASAGGLTDFANSKKMYILRSEDGKHQKIRVRYKQALKGDPASNLVLQPGDTIIVP
jgi:polysaccharide export outer membrane protein